MTPYCAGAVSPDPAERITERQRETAVSPCCGCASDAPGRLLINSIIVGFGLFFNPALGPGASIGLSAEKEGSQFLGCPCGWAILLCHLKTEIEALNMFLLVGLKFSLYYPFCASLLVVP